MHSNILLKEPWAQNWILPIIHPRSNIMCTWLISGISEYLFWRAIHTSSLFKRDRSYSSALAEWTELGFPVGLCSYILPSVFLPVHSYKHFTSFSSSLPTPNILILISKCEVYALANWRAMYELMNWPSYLSSIQLPASPYLKQNKFFTPISLTNTVNTHQQIWEFSVGARV